MKNPTDDDAYNALFRSYEDSNRRIKELEIQCGHLRLTISKLESLLVQAGSNVDELIWVKAQLAAAQEQVAAVTEQRNAAIEAVMGEDYVFGQDEIEDTSTLHEIIFDQVEAEKASARVELQAQIDKLKVDREAEAAKGVG